MEDKNKKQEIKEGSLSDSELNNVAGGGGCNSRVDKIEHFESEESVVFKYNIGDIVEVYWTDAHQTTFTGKIVERRVAYSRKGKYYYDRYSIVNMHTSEKFLRGRDYIQLK